MLAPQAKIFSVPKIGFWQGQQKTHSKNTHNRSHDHHDLLAAENHQNREIDSIYLARGLKFNKVLLLI